MMSAAIPAIDDRPPLPGDLAMWFFILFAVVHVYLVFYHDYVEGRGEISSMGGGWKFIEEEAVEELKHHHK